MGWFRSNCGRFAWLAFFALVLRDNLDEKGSGDRI
jgi:hypothetical protein